MAELEPCPGAEVLAEFAQGVLEGPALAAFTRHLDQCERCRQQAVAAAQAVHSEPAGAVSVVTVSDRRPGAGPGPGTRLGRYVLLEELGSGGMGQVFRAHDPHLERQVALKVLHARPGVDDVPALLEEARATARLVHPNVVTLHDVGIEGARAFVAMELLEGGTVRAWLRSAKRSPRDILELFLAAGAGLAAAHRAGLVHRDFKPDNVLLGADGRPRVVDFGLAREVPAPASDSEAPRTATSSSGTPGYMAPEQYFGRSDARSDEFAFCVSLWEALTGTRPYPGREGLFDAMEAQRRSGELPRELGRRARRALERGLSFRAEDRFRTMDELLSELAGSASSGWPRAATWTAGVALLGAAATAAWALWPPPSVAREVPAVHVPMAVDAQLAAEPLPDAGVRAPEAVVRHEAPDAGPRERPRGERRPARTGKGVLLLRVNPWAEVTLDGRSLGMTPLAPMEVTTGRHRLLLENRDLGVRRELSVDVREGRETLVKQDLLE